MTKYIQTEFNGEGYRVIKFMDLYGETCSLKKSSLVEQDAIWFGVKNSKINQMHLTRDMVRELLPYLHIFVETGDIEPDEREKCVNCKNHADDWLEDDDNKISFYCSDCKRDEQEKRREKEDKNGFSW